jgi:predicted DNA-binding transcriptional regulator YafY
LDFVSHLEEWGFPIETVRGRYGGYRLPSSWMPATALSDDEIVALTFGLMWSEGSGACRSAPGAALSKLEPALPQGRRQQLRALFNSLQFAEYPMSSGPAGTLLIALGLAAQEGQRVQLRYRSFDGRSSERAVDPHGLVYFRRYWYLVGYCHLRGARRIFRLDRIASLGLRVETFQPPPRFDARAYLLESMVALPGTWDVAVVIEATLPQAQRQIPQGLGTLTAVSDGVLFECAINSLPFLARLLSRLDYPFTVHKPPELRSEIKTLALNLTRMAERS